MVWYDNGREVVSECVSKKIYIWMDMDGWVGGWASEWMGGWINRYAKTNAGMRGRQESKQYGRISKDTT